MKKLSLLLVTLLAFSFTACSTKKVFEPKVVGDDWEKYGSFDESISDITGDVALLENRTVLTKDKVIAVEIPEEYRLLAKSDGWVVSSTIDGDVLLQYVEDKSMTEKFKLNKTVAGASVKGDILAVLFADNEMALYSISNKELLLKEQGNVARAVDSRIVNPYFLDDLVLFPTLDGKIVIIDAKIKKKLRTIIVSSETDFNNVVYFNIVDNKIVAATGHTILSMSTKEQREKYDIRTIAYDQKNIYISTKQGEVISMTPELVVNAKVKFPFAHFLGMIVNDKGVYLLEKEGYIIELKKDLSEYSVHEVDISDGYVFTADKMFFVDDEYISVE